MMMALAGDARPARACSCPAASRCRPSDGEDAGKVQTIGARFAHGEITLEEAAELGCRACATPGGGCQFLGTAATVAGRRRGARPGAAALRRSRRPGQPIWLDMARRSARALVRPGSARPDRRATSSPTPPIRNAMTVHAAFGGSTNLLLHIPAIAYAAGLPRPTVEDWNAVNRQRAAPRRRPAQRPGRPSDRPRLPGRRRAGGHAAPARARPARSKRA